jgi:predicted DNA-binding ribbon-helix-helix protein
MAMKHIERVQTGLRLEKRLLKVLKGLAEYLDVSVAELIEAMALHALEGKVPPFSPAMLAKIEGLKTVYGLDLTAADAHHLTEGDVS